ncbi:acetolactate decarboxylase [Lamprobacter modestohalophilus]|uniref:acetolactate decarboxylase n=1 Tax=Lamprobacter modestohalophilus TaxID=1064514 RepID=UPI002ADEB1D3|nr:acetolactate decarboxylase [Lamprobacter modestohalophilus]MEA1050054.1 acetolactate decarboxylase [Lamprobacter modestohalophilus]
MNLNKASRLLRLRIAAVLISTLFASSLLAEERRDEVLYQVSTIDALLAGVYDSAATVGDLLKHGGFGLGTFAALDGELIALDGVVYQAASDGQVRTMPPETGTPFMAVTEFAADQAFVLSEPLDLKAFEAQLEQRFPSRNMIYAIKAVGRFAQIRYRSVPRQQRPYAPLAEVAREQVLFDQQDIDGTLIGFWCPSFCAGINVPGFHLHFLSADRAHGGHVLGFSLQHAEVELDHTRGWEIALPAIADYLDANLDSDRSAELYSVEQDRASREP